MAGSNGSDVHRQDMRQRMAAKRAEHRNVIIPPIVDLKRRKRCAKSLKLFLKTYFPEMFNKPWSDAHKECLDKMQYTIMYGGMVADAMPRGEGKTTIAKGGALWAVCNDFRNYLILIGATEPKAEGLLKDIKGMLRFSDKLCEDYPEICVPIRELNNVSTRTRAQTCQLSRELAEQIEKLFKLKNLTCDRIHSEMTWTTKRLVLPTIEGCPTSGKIVEIAGITGDIRGRTSMRTDGVVIRPDIAIADDPQTADSAKSPSQCNDREHIINADVLGLAGPGQKITCFMPCTVIRPDDLAERFLDHDKNPDWQGVRSKMIVSWPEKMELWEEYNKVRIRGLKKQDKAKMANGFYRKHKAELEKGAKVSWEARKAEGDVSALQHAMDLYFRLGERAFYSEYQNDPIPEYMSMFELSEEVVASRAVDTDYRYVPEHCNFLTCMGDVNQYGIHYVVLSATSDFAGWVVDYGKYPEGEKNWIWREDETRGKTLAQAIYDAVYGFCEEMSGRKYIKGNDVAQLDLLSVDCGWMMEQVLRAVSMANRKLPVEIVGSRGFPFSNYRTTKTHGRPGDNCHRAVFEKQGNSRVICHNADYWRERAQQGFLCMPGSPASIALFGKPDNHSIFAQHICAEILREHIQTEKGEYYNWVRKPGVRNDLLDALVGAMVNANILGASFDGINSAAYVPTKKVSGESPTDSKAPKQEPSAKPARKKRRVVQASYGKI